MHATRQGYSKEVAETAVLDELLSRREDGQSARDRLLAAILVIATLHGVAILGISFRRAYAAAGSAPAMLQVLLVSDKAETADAATAADYLSNASQRGTGTDPKLQVTRSPQSKEPRTEPGTPDKFADPASTTNSSAKPELLTGASPDRTWWDKATAPARTLAPLPVYTQEVRAEVRGVESSDALALRGQPRLDEPPNPNTQRSEVAVYLDGWRHKIEKTGTENYPVAALNRAGLSGNPILEVQILADGRLGEVILKRSSGHPELDQAALGILHLAAPFDAFSATLAAQHPSLRLSYEWQFRGGQLQAPSSNSTRRTY